MKWKDFSIRPPIGAIILCYCNDGTRRLVISGDSIYQDQETQKRYFLERHPYLYWCQPGYPI